MEDFGAFFEKICTVPILENWEKWNKLKSLVLPQRAWWRNSKGVWSNCPALRSFKFKIIIFSHSKIWTV